MGNPSDLLNVTFTAETIKNRSVSAQQPLSSAGG
jgi:hypothetical protein